MTPPFRRRHPPPWWPAGEPWPPRGHGSGFHDRRSRIGFFRRVIFGAAVLVILAVGGLFALASAITARLGPAGWAAPVVVLVLLFAAAFVLFRSAGVIRHVAFPLRAMMDAADRVADGDYDVRVREQGPPPIRALVRSFNTMTERLLHADRQRRDLMADVAHELRTPLSVLQARLEGLMDGVYPRDDGQLAQLLAETQVLSRLIEDLRTLALTDAGALRLQREAIDVVGLAREVVHSLDAEAIGASVSLSAAPAAEGVVLEVDPVRIREVLTNLVSNALRHTPAGGTVTVSVEHAADGVAIVVTDTGEGMRAEEVARMFDRFYKGPGSSGSGLGLAIARSLVTAHGGTITASSQVERGTTVTVTLPRNGETDA